LVFLKRLDEYLLKQCLVLFSGNVGNAFSIDAETGVLQVARELDLSTNKEYMLTIKASDGGSPSLSSTLRVHVMVTMADNAPPKYKF